MTNLAEKSQWEEGIYQLETSDPVVGGPEGIDNLQPRQLANRTRYLKDQQEAHASAANPHPQYAKTDSPAFTGVPQAPQPAQFDNTTKIASTSFVQRALGNFQGFNGYTSSQALKAEQAGSVINFWGAAASTFTLPACSTLPYGGSFLFNNSGSAPVTVTRAGQDTILCNGNNSSVVLNPNDNLLLVAVPPNQWIATGGSAQLKNTSAMSGANFTTAPQFDKTTKLATTEFVQQASGNFQTRKYVSGSATLTNSDTGSWVEAGGLGPSTITLPAPTANNITYTITNVTSNGTAVTISTPSASIYNQASAASTFLLDVGATVELTSDSSNWTVIRHYTRSPVAQTPVQFDNSWKLATTQFVQRALGNMRSGVRMQTAGAISASSTGGAFTLEVTNGSFSLPSLSSVAPGAVIEVLVTVANVTVSRTGSDGILLGSSTVASLVMNNGETAKFVAFDSFWVVISGSASLRANYGDFNSQFAANGYQKLPSGLLIQWGVVNVPAGATYTYNFPLAYLAGCYSLVGARGAPGSNASFNFSPISVSQFQTQNYGTGTEIASWISIGR